MPIQGTFPTDDQEPSARREYGFWWGLVTDNRDPDGRGRVRANIPGLNNGESGWIEAVGNPGQGGKRHGMFATPKIGANIVVGFIQGDIDEPIYWGGPPPIDEVSDGGENPDNVVLAETDSFRVIASEDAGAKKLRIETRLQGATDAQKASAQSYIELTTTAGDAGKAHAILIHAASGLKLTSRGGIEIDGATVSIKGRPVDPAQRSI